MHPFAQHSQRIARVASLAEVLCAVDRCASPVAAREVDLAAAVGRVVAAEVCVPEALPATPVAVRDGWAVRSDLLADAGPYAPVALAPPRWVDCGDAMPPGCDAVLPPDGLEMSGGACEAIAAVAPGEGIVPAAFDAAAGAILRAAGERLRAIDIAVLRGAGVVRVAIRAPRIGVIGAATGPDTIADFVSHAVAAGGGIVERLPAPPHEAATLAALGDAGTDALITIGGTGQGRDDRTAHAVASAGELLIHGMGIRPGETGGLGVVNGRPALLLPGRLDAALAVWLLIGQPLLRRLTGAAAPEPASKSKLARKLVSTVGIAEVVLVRPVGDGVEPIAAGALPLQALARAVGWVLVRPESEGYASGATVDVNPLP